MLAFSGAVGRSRLETPSDALFFRSYEWISNWYFFILSDAKGRECQKEQRQEDVFGANGGFGKGSEHCPTLAGTEMSPALGDLSTPTSGSRNLRVREKHVRGTQQWQGVRYPRIPSETLPSGSGGWEAPAEEETSSRQASLLLPDACTAASCQVSRPALCGPENMPRPAGAPGLVPHSLRLNLQKTGELHHLWIPEAKAAGGSGSCSAGAKEAGRVSAPDTSARTCHGGKLPPAGSLVGGTPAQSRPRGTVSHGATCAQNRFKVALLNQGGRCGPAEQGCTPPRPCLSVLIEDT